MGQTTVNDPVFGKLIYDGNHHGGWATSFIDARFAGWGEALDKHYADLEDDEPGPRTDAEGFAKELLAIAGNSIDPAIAEQALASARAFDAYDGSLDAQKLRKVGRLKLVIPNRSDNPPTPEQQAAWRAFHNGGDALAEQIADRLFSVYRQQRPELLRWWAAIYGDSPDAFLPEVASPHTMRSIVRPGEFRVYPEEDDDGVAVGILFDTLWSNRSIDLRVREGGIVSVGPEKVGLQLGFTSKRFDAPPFGPMRRSEYEGWFGTFHCDDLRGYHPASQERHRFATSPRPTDALFRQIPPWDVITGDFELQVSDDAGEGPTAAQTDAYRKFSADPKQTARLVLAAILHWYQRNLLKWVSNLRAGPDKTAAIFPVIDSPEGLLEIIQLQGITVWPESEEDDKPVAIGLKFYWEDEHGIGVRWRNGQIEAVGDSHTAIEE
jgi:hypothetical protein